jgi:L-asparaginase/Glu-tRNA(Gln) amidotransferase subunit D
MFRNPLRRLSNLFARSKGDRMQIPQAKPPLKDNPEAGQSPPPNAKQKIVIISAGGTPLQEVTHGVLSSRPFDADVKRHKQLTKLVRKLREGPKRQTAGAELAEIEKELAPFRVSLEEKLAPILDPLRKQYDFEIIDLFRAEGDEFRGGVDSNEMDMARTKKLAETIVHYQNDDSVSGIVGIHGTDTMPETLMELEYAIKNLKKPNVLTGAQYPMFDDPRFANPDPQNSKPSNPFKAFEKNLKRSITLAAADNFNRNAICFGYATGDTNRNYVIGARNAEKESAESQNAFLHPDATIYGRVAVKHGFTLGNDPYERENPILMRQLAQWVKLEPNYDAPTTLDFKFAGGVKKRDIYKQHVDLPIFARGLVLGLRPKGNAPAEVARRLKWRSRFYPLIATSHTKGKVSLIGMSPEGSHFSYDAGSGVLAAGALPSGGHTPLSALKRLSYILAHNQQIKSFAKRSKLKYRSLRDALYLSGGQFDNDEIKRAHAEALKLPITEQDLLVHIPFEQALSIIAKRLRSPRLKI